MRSASALVLLSLTVLLARPAHAEDVDRVVLRVNDQITTLREYQERRDERLQSIAAASDLSLDARRQLAADAGKAAMNEIFEEMLILSRAQQLHIEATPAKIDRAVDQARQRYGIDTEEEFERALVQSGGTIALFRDRMARNILFSEVMQHEVASKINVDDEEIPRYWRSHPDEFVVPEQRHVEEAVIRDDSGLAADERAQRAAEIRTALLEGTPLTEAVDGDENVIVLDHEWIEKGTLDATLETAAWELDAGGVSEPIAARGGLHVLHVIEIRPSSRKPIESVREEILGKLRDEQFETESRKFLEQLANTAYIVERLPEDAVGYRSEMSGSRDPLRELLRGADTAKLGGEPTGEKAAPAEESAGGSPPTAQFERN